MTIGVSEHREDARQTDHGHVQHHEEEEETKKEASEKTERARVPTSAVKKHYL